MDERRRFQIALGGVASTVFIAALFVSSAPPLVYPPVPAPQPFVRVVNAGPERPTLLPEASGMPPLAEALRPRRRPARPLRQDRPRAELGAPSPTTAPSAEATAEAMDGGGRPLPTRGPQIVLTSAPAARGARLAVSVGDPESAGHDPKGRGPLTGAFATAGKEVGRGFRTAGRAIRAIF